MPCDETEKERLDTMHAMIKTIRPREHRLIHAPFHEARPNPTGFERSRILDLGCGTGIWALEMGEKFHQSEVLGIDLNRMGPPTLLDNVDLRVPVDYESPWSLGEDSWDLIHLQMGLGSVGSWPSLYRKILTHLKPGTGWFESVEIDFRPQCDDGTLPEGALHGWYQYIAEAYSNWGSRSIRFNPNSPADLERAGFTNVQHYEYTLPLNPWVLEEEDRAKHRAGNWYRFAMSSNIPQDSNFGMEAMSLAVLTRGNSWHPDNEARRLCNDALAEALNPNVHAYNTLHIITARKPYPDEPQERAFT